MGRAFYVKAGFIAAVTLLALWLLLPTIYYFHLPADERNQPDKLAAALPKWAPPPAQHLNLGLDLQGGVFLVLEVDTAAALAGKVAHRADEIVSWAERDEHISGVHAVAQGPSISLSTDDPAKLAPLRAAVVGYFRDMRVTGEEASHFTLAFLDASASRVEGDAVDQALKVITNRVNRWGVTEPVISKRGANEIVVELPGFKDPERAKALLGKTAQLEFKIVDDQSPYFKELTPLPASVQLAYESYAGPGGQIVASPYLIAAGEDGRQVLEAYIAHVDRVPAGRQVGYGCIPDPKNPDACEAYRTYLLECRPGSGANQCLAPITGDSIVDARVVMGQGQGIGAAPQVTLELDRQGSDELAALSTQNVGRRLAIVLDRVVTSAPVIEEKITGGNAAITLRSAKPYQELLAEAKDLALVLKAGALPAPVKVGEERTVGASLGPELIHRGALSVITGLFLVLLFMAVYYRLTGTVADLALLLNGLLALAAMALLGATLTLPGIAGFVLTLGMAVDANVLINERIREELRRGRTTGVALRTGFSRAWRAIIDGHVTALIAGFVLLQYGSGPVRGFAVMLIVGLVASLFTAVVVTRAMMDWLVLRRASRTARTGHRGALAAGAELFHHERSLDFIGKRRFFLALSSAVNLFVIAGAALWSFNWGVDFAGGSEIEIAFAGEVSAENVRRAVSEAGFADASVQVMGNPAAHAFIVRVGRTGGEAKSGVPSPGKPPATSDIAGRVRAGLQTASQHGLVPAFQIRRVEFVGPQVGRALRAQGILAVLYASLGILIYIAIRFDTRFAPGAVVAMFHDIIVVLGYFLVSRREFNLTSVAVLLTIVGYSVNDTIVVYDRIRENLAKKPGLSLPGLINLSINETLSRTLLTSFATALSLMGLIIFGVGQIWDFAAAMLLGIITGTYSSIYIASPLTIWLEELKARKRRNVRSG